MFWTKKEKKALSVSIDKKEIPDGLWIKCPACEGIFYRDQLEKDLWICPKCDYHFRLFPSGYIRLFIDNSEFQEIDKNLVSVDVLNFVDSKPYPKRISASHQKTGQNSGIITGLGRIGGITSGFGVMNFGFIGGSMGSVVGEKIARLFDRAITEKLPVVLVCASGGARMQESILSLMQMAKTSAMVARHSKLGLPYITVLTHPTTAGVMASYASLGDVIIAEPKALLGFAGPRVIQQTIGGELPEGFQLSEFFLQHGFVDIVCRRSELKTTVAKLLNYMAVDH